MILPFLIKFVEKEFKVSNSNNQNYISISKLRTPFILSREYRKVEINIKAVMEILGPMFPVGQGLIGHLGIMVNFVAVRHWNDISLQSIVVILLASISIQLCWVTVLSIAGNATGHFGEILISWKYIKARNVFESRYMKKVRKSCKPIVIGLDGYYKIKRISACKYLNGFARSTFRLLLTI